MDDSTWLVVGLGNPGSGYAAHRHNVGAMAVSELSGRMSASLRHHKTNASVAEGRLTPGGPRIVLAVPGSFMNLSGGPVSSLLKYFSVPVSRLIVMHDELDIPFDSLKLKLAGGHGGHNGVRDIISATGSPDFIRVRIGIGRPPGRQSAADFVLKDFSSTERSVLPNLLSDAADAVELIVNEGLTAAQLSVHTAG